MKNFLIIFFCISCSVSDNSTDFDFLNLFHKSVAVVNKTIVHDVFSPPVASRVYAYPFISAYECAIIGDSTFLSLSMQLNDFDVGHHEIDANTELTAILAFLTTSRNFVFTKSYIDDYIDSLASIFPQSSFNDAYRKAISLTEKVMEWSYKDGYKLTRSMTKYNVSAADVSSGQWIPTPPNYMAPIEPHWGRMRPFVLASASQFKPANPPEYSLNKNSDFFTDLMELYDSTRVLSKKNIEIAKFWDCNPFVMTNTGHNMSSYKKITPGGHWIGIAGIAAKTKQANFTETVATYAITSIAIADGFISCWDEKYRSNLIRPETVINFNIDPSWKPILQTPPFPEYTSGHSVVSGAAASVLTKFVGEDFEFTDTTELIYNLPSRRYGSFYLASEEAAISRFYGGIHYMPAIEEGLQQGYNIGTYINNHLILRK